MRRVSSAALVSIADRHGAHDVHPLRLLRLRHPPDPDLHVRRHRHPHLRREQRGPLRHLPRRPLHGLSCPGPNRVSVPLSACHRTNHLGGQII